eukprot:CAMPEP_0180112562 /NCGR_PEP_ID=MMETSP0985-20121206/36275_1 /TAXON_ID=483367 /ORGANISM="non described non described, Strain CCMP 2436" /LENGTH=79 /DNA_ID=CAMNT_0022050927 /DNA_START=686 /DNA_END=925 /DNA_ORIENTATION=+
MGGISKCSAAAAPPRFKSSAPPGGFCAFCALFKKERAHSGEGLSADCLLACAWTASGARCKFDSADPSFLKPSSVSSGA